MFRLIKQVFCINEFWWIFGNTMCIMSLGGFLATKCVSLSNEPSMNRPTPINLNSVKLNYYPFKVSLNKSSGSCNGADDLSKKICIPGKIRDINIKVFNIIRWKNEAKTLIKHISCKLQMQIQHVIQIKNGITIHVNVGMSSISRARNIAVGILAYVFVRVVDIYKVLLIL